jgi:hypothetical protein
VSHPLAALFFPPSALPAWRTNWNHTFSGAHCFPRSRLGTGVDTLPASAGGKSAGKGKAKGKKAASESAAAPPAPLAEVVLLQSVVHRALAAQTGGADDATTLTASFPVPHIVVAIPSGPRGAEATRAMRAELAALEAAVAEAACDPTPLPAAASGDGDEAAALAALGVVMRGRVTCSSAAGAHRSFATPLLSVDFVPLCDAGGAAAPCAAEGSAAEGAEAAWSAAVRVAARTDILVATHDVASMLAPWMRPWSALLAAEALDGAPTPPRAARAAGAPDALAEIAAALHHRVRAIACVNPTCDDDAQASSRSAAAASTPDAAAPAPPLRSALLAELAAF